ncbi:hypothetical protein TSUD_24770 [Trifolium subterraneum]|uniref:Uncharacterized protein n=1 Tax=Trifolium subterraneum TaxID=3900 RepID=A0A2Z6LQ03_TRISU|nr:hypothetical protein TSUD_24770 [Trifolium subterraneum]
MQGVEVSIMQGETYLRNLHEQMRKDHINNAHETSGVVLTVWMITFDSRLEDILNSPSGREVHVLLWCRFVDTWLIMFLSS